MRKVIKRIVGYSNIYYLKSLFKGKEEKVMFDKRVTFYKQFLSPGDLYFDIGANLGNRIGPALKLQAKVVAVEPQRECCLFLKKKYGNAVKIINKGAGAKVGEQDFFQSETHMISSFSTDWIDAVKKSGRFSDREWEKKGTIPLTTLDTLINEYGIPKFIKIDVEGYEPEVLKGLSQPVNYLSFEYNVPEQQAHVADCLRRLKGISGDIECNYSSGESMEWATQQWRSAEEMIRLMQSDFAGFGDVYVRSVNQTAHSRNS